MKENYKNEVRYYTFPAFEEHPEIVHAFTSRECGVSDGYYSSLNMGIHTGDDLENVKTNYRILCQTLSLDPEKIVLANLVHGDTIRNVTAADAGAGLWRDFPYEGVDGLLTNEPGLILTATFADCVPVFFYDPVKKVIGIAHSGWKGTALEIASKMVDRMQSDYGCKVEDILAGIGPSIGMCCKRIRMSSWNSPNFLISMKSGFTQKMTGNSISIYGGLILKCFFMRAFRKIISLSPDFAPAAIRISFSPTAQARENAAPWRELSL